MEMCYDGTLVMPSSYVVMDAEEMTYVEGGAVVSNRDLKAFLGMAGLAFIVDYATRGYSAIALVKYLNNGLNIIKGALLTTGWGAAVSAYLCWKGGQFIEAVAECLDDNMDLKIGWGWTGVYFKAV